MKLTKPERLKAEQALKQLCRVQHPRLGKLVSAREQAACEKAIKEG